MKRYLLLLALICSLSVHAAETPSGGGSSFAVMLARQAGLIAGAAEACGHNVSLLAARLDEAIQAVAQNTIDSSDAIAAYQQSAKEAKALQSSTPRMPCEQIVKDYNSLPLLRDDYKEVVLTALKADDKAQQAKVTTASAASTPPAIPASPPTAAK